MAFRSASAANGASPVDPGKPAGTVSSDIIVGFVQTENAAETAPSGWTSIRRDVVGVTAVRAYWAVGSVASTSFSWTGGVVGNVQIQAFSGRDTTTPITDHLGQADAAATTATAPTVTAALNDDAAAAWASDSDAFGAISDATYTERTNQLNADGIRLATGSKDALSAGATGTKTRASTPTAFDAIGQHILLKVAAGGAVASASELPTIAWPTSLLPGPWLLDTPLAQDYNAAPAPAAALTVLIAQFRSIRRGIAARLFGRVN